MGEQVAVHAWNPAGADADEQFAAVIALHRENRSTLGHLPFAAFTEAGRQGQLLVATIAGQICGYVLFSTPRQSTVKLVHVCVSQASRNAGVARALVDEVIDRNPARGVLTAHCRVDYHLDRFWRSLDMAPTGQRPGRAAHGSTLTIWTRRFGQLDLFESAVLDSARPLAVLDTNIIIDLYCSTALHRPDREESLGLTDDWLVDVVDLAVSPEVAVEVATLDPPAEAQRVREGMSALTPTRRTGAMRDTALALLAEMPPEVVARDTSLPDDAVHLADAILAGADFFVTRDTTLLAATKEWALSAYGIDVVRPADLLSRFIPPQAPTQFRSGQLESVGLDWVAVTAVSRDLEDRFVDRDRSEKGTHFRKQLHAALAHPARVRLEVLTDERGREWALLATETAEHTLTVSTLRVGGGSLGPTIAFQLTRYLRELALAHGLTMVTVKDEHLPAVLQAALDEDGFHGHPLRAHLARVPAPSDIADVQDRQAVAAYERRNWPQVVLDRPVPVRVVPIRPDYARELLGFNETLLRTRERTALGFNREFVYFAAPKMRHWDVPSRVLWYVTKNKKAREREAVRAVVAHSRVVDATVMDVDDAIEQYKALGVLRQDEIIQQARRGRVLVLRFEDTHLLTAPVSTRTFRRLLTRHGVTTSLLTARVAPPALFDDVLATQPEWDRVE